MSKTKVFSPDNSCRTKSIMGLKKNTSKKKSRDREVLAAPQPKISKGKINNQEQDNAIIKKGFCDIYFTPFFVQCPPEPPGLKINHADKNKGLFCDIYNFGWIFLPKLI